ncbi:g8284 [Coccomyxa elongata]
MSTWAPTSVLQNLAKCARDADASNVPFPSKESLDEVEEILGYTFHNHWLLRLALTHCSVYSNNNISNLAWMGDAALYMVVTEQLSATYSNADTGDLSMARARLVSREMCSQRAKGLQLEKHMVVGKSVLSNKGMSDAMIAEMFEATLGAIYIDGGLESVRAIYNQHFPLPESLRHVLKPPLS